MRKLQRELPTIASHLTQKIRRGYLLAVSMIAIFVLILGSTLWIRTATSHLNFLGNSLSHLILPHVVSGETLPIGQLLDEYETRKWTSKVAVLDKELQPIYSADESGSPFLLLETTADLKKFSLVFPVEADGFTLGYLAFSPKIIDTLLPIMLLTVAVVLGLALIYFYFVRVLIPKGFSDTEESIQSVTDLFLNLSRELQSIHLHSKTTNESVLKDYQSKLDNVRVATRETTELRASLSNILAALRTARRDQEQKKAVEQVSAQVEHDIRSPLAALEMVNSVAAQELPEELRLVIRGAVARIRDIANSLRAQKLEEKLAVVTALDAQSELIGSILDSIVTEKRIQFLNKAYLSIDIDFSIESYGLFARVNGTELKRVISNLINNAVEADGNSVRVLSAKSGNEISISIIDNGKGIPKEVLPKLGSQGATFNKEGGTGLGLFHARQSIESWGGSLNLESIFGEGTTVTIKLPVTTPPTWFTPSIPLEGAEKIVVLDDDASIHRVWERKLGKDRTLVHFSNVEEFEKGLDPRANQFYLMDYEIVGSQLSGLDLIEKHGLAGKAVLVTSRFEERELRVRSEKLGVKIVPKNLAPFLPNSPIGALQ